MEGEIERERGIDRGGREGEEREREREREAKASLKVKTSLNSEHNTKYVF